MYGGRAWGSTPTSKKPEGESYANTNANAYGFGPSYTSNSTPPPASSIQKEEEMKSEDPVIILIDGERKMGLP